jgi:plastocyanin
VSLALLAAAAGACGGGGSSKVATPPDAKPDVIVRVVDDAKTTGAFSPKSQPVRAGGIVAWTNESGAVHNVTFAKSGPKSSSTFSKGQTFKATFPKAGTYPYVCTIHPAMKGEVVVG